MKTFKTLLSIVLVALAFVFTSNTAFAQTTKKPGYGNSAGNGIKGSIPIAEHYEGGKEALLKAIHDAIVYPPDAKRNRIQGQVNVRVTIQKDGTLKNVKVVKDIGAGCGEHAKEVVMGLKFNAPGYISEYTIPVKFKL